MPALLGHVPLCAVAMLRRRRQALAGEEGFVLCVGDADHVGGADLQLQEAVADANEEAVRDPLDVAARRDRVGEGRPARAARVRRWPPTGGAWGTWRCAWTGDLHEKGRDIFTRRWAWPAQLPHIRRAQRGGARLHSPANERPRPIDDAGAGFCVGGGVVFQPAAPTASSASRGERRRPRRPTAQAARTASARLRRPALRHVPPLRDPHVHRERGRKPNLDIQQFNPTASIPASGPTPPSPPK